jgi:Flp pilus assembly protein TadD
VGLAALYARNYGASTTSLTNSLQLREDKLAADKKAAERAVADAAFFSGLSQFEQGRHRESATAYQRCLQIRPDDATVLNNAALSLAQAGDYAGAESIFRQALLMKEESLGGDHPSIATGLNNLAEVLRAKGDDFGAEPLYWRAPFGLVPLWLSRTSLLSPPGVGFAAAG